MSMVALKPFLCFFVGSKHIAQSSIVTFIYYYIQFMNKTIITVTQNALKKMSIIMKKANNNIGFLFGITSGGCSGFNFDLKLMNESDMAKVIKSKPHIVQYSNVNVYVDPLGEMYLFGTEIDYVNEDFKKGIFESKFVYNINKKSIYMWLWIIFYTKVNYSLNLSRIFSNILYISVDTCTKYCFVNKRAVFSLLNAIRITLYVSCGWYFLNPMNFKLSSSVLL